MNSDWREIKIEEIAKSIAMGPFGSDIKTDNFVSEGVPVIRGGNLSDGGFQDEGFVFLTEAKADQLRSANATKGDLVFTHRGTLGQVSIIPKKAKFPRYVVSQSQMRMTCDVSKVAPEFLFYFFRSSEGQHKLLVNTSQTGVPAISRPVTSLKAIKLNLPPLPEQKAIARVLGSLDDKIELNRRTNATLESLAQTLFRAWFVDFEPMKVRPNSGVLSEVAALFPSEFENSALGLIPKGWKVVSLFDIAQPTIGGDWGEDESSDKNNVLAICLRGTDLESLRWTGEAVRAPLRWLSPSSLSKRILDEKDVLIGGSGAGPCGKPFWGFSGFQKQYDYPVIYSNFVKRFRAGTVAEACYVDRILQMMKESGEMDNFINGTSVPNLNDKQLLTTKKVALPPENVLKAYSDFMRPLQERLFSGESAKLSAIRDALLPRLISGRLRVPEAMREVEATA